MPKNCHFSICLRTKNSCRTSSNVSRRTKNIFFISVYLKCYSTWLSVYLFGNLVVFFVIWDTDRGLKSDDFYRRRVESLKIISSDGKFDNHAMAFFKSVNIRNTHAGGALVRYTFENVVCDDWFSRRNRCVLGEFCPKRCAECGYRLSVIVSTTRKSVDSKETRNRARKRPGRSRRQITDEKSKR